MGPRRIVFTFAGGGEASVIQTGNEISLPLYTSNPKPTLNLAVKKDLKDLKDLGLDL